MSPTLWKTKWCACSVFILLHIWIDTSDTICSTISRKGLSRILLKQPMNLFTMQFLLRGGQSSDKSDSENNDSGTGAVLPDDFPAKFASEANFEAAKKAYSTGDAEAYRAAIDKVRIDSYSK
jgi:hypothetical protein